MGDEEDGAPVRGQIADDREQAVSLLWREDRGRLVEDQDFRVTIERLQDLDPLANPDRKPADDRRRIDLQMKAPSERADFGDRRGTVDEAEPPRLAGVDDVLPYGERIEELEGLVDHAHAFSDGVESRAETDFHASQDDPPLVGRLHAVEDRHQGRFPGAVLSHDRVDFAARRLEVDVVVGDERAIAFDDADRLELDFRHRRPLAYLASFIGSSTLSLPEAISSRSAFTFSITSGYLAIRQPDFSTPGSRPVRVMPPSARPSAATCG